MTAVDRLQEAWDDHPELVVLAVIAVVIAVFLAFAIPAINREAAAYEEACNALGGHTNTTHHTAINTKDGSPIVSSETICIRDNQRIYP